LPVLKRAVADYDRRLASGEIQTAKDALRNEPHRR